MSKTFFAGMVASLVFGVVPVFAQENVVSQVPSMSTDSSQHPTPVPGADLKQMPPPQGGDSRQMPMQNGQNFGPNMGSNMGPSNFGGQNMGPNMGSQMNQQDTRWFGQPGMNEGDYDKQNEQRQKQDEERMKKDEERQKKQQEQQEERMKKEQERNLKMMKSGFKKGLQGMTQMRNRIVGAEKGILGKCGVTAPQSLKDALTKVDEIAGKIDASTDFEEVQGFMMDFQEAMNDFRESEGSLGMMMQFCQQIVPEANRQLKGVSKQYSRLNKLVQKAEDVDLSGVLAEYKAALDGFPGVLAQVKASFSADPEKAMDTMKEAMEGIFTKQSEIEAVANMGDGLKKLKKEIGKLNKQLAKLKKNEDVDTSSLEDAIDSFAAEINEIASLRKTKADPEELMGAFESAFEAMETAYNAVEELGGTAQYSNTLNFNAKAKSYNLSVPKMNFNQYNLPQQRPGMQQGVDPRMMNQMGPGMGQGPMGPGGSEGFPGGQEFNGGPQGGFGPQSGGFGPPQGFGSEGIIIHSPTPSGFGGSQDSRL